MHYYPHHIGDYRRDTSALTLLEHGIYRALLDEYYVTEKPLPKCQKQLARIIHAHNRVEKASLASVVSAFFTETKDGLEHKRVNAEIEAYKAMAEKNRRNGARGGRPRSEKPSGIPTGNPVGNPNETQTKANQEPRTKNQEPKGESAPPVSLQTAIASGATSGIRAEVATAWWHARDSVGWTENGARILNWRSSLQAFWTRWQSNEARRAQTQRNMDGVTPSGNARNWSRTMGVG